jgi:hypothetical protein
MACLIGGFYLPGLAIGENLSELLFLVHLKEVTIRTLKQHFSNVFLEVFNLHLLCLVARGLP